MLNEETRVMGRLLRGLGWAALLLALVAWKTAAQVQPDIQQIPDFGAIQIAGAPKIQVTGADVIATPALKAAHVVIKWSATVPNLSSLTKFEASAEVVFANGTTRRFTQAAAAADRTATVVIPNEDRAGGQIKKALVIATYKSVALVPPKATAELTMNNDNNFTASQSPPTHPGLRIGGVKRLSSGTNDDQFLVTWGAPQAIPSFDLTGFKVLGEFAYQSGGTPLGMRNANGNVGPTVRQATLTVESVKVTPEQAKGVKITAKLTVLLQGSVIGQAVATRDIP